MGYIVMLIFFITPLMGIILYYYTYREEVKEEFQDLKNQYEMNTLQSTLKLQSYQQKLQFLEKEEKYYHDLKNHLQVLESLYKRGNIEKAQKYQQEIIENIPKSNTIIYNELLNVVLHDFKSKCNIEDIHLKLIIDKSIIFDKISDFDIVAIFTNIFDNAFEAAKNSKEKHISVEIRIVDQFIVSVVKNSYKDSLIEKDKFFESTKNGHKGYGISNVVDIIEKYNGTYLIENDDSMFTFQIILPI